MSQRSASGDDPRSEKQKTVDAQLAERLSSLIEDANKRVIPLCKMIRKVSSYRVTSPLHLLFSLFLFIFKNIENFQAQKEEDRDEGELVKQVRPLIEQAEKVLNETNGAIRGADPDNRLSNKATRNMQDRKATPEEQRLAEALKTVRLQSLLHRMMLLILLL